MQWNNAYVPGEKKKIHNLYGLPKPAPSDNMIGTLCQQRPFNVAIIDDIAEVQALNKPDMLTPDVIWLNTSL